jgi:hypothetical protein
MDKVKFKEVIAMRYLVLLMVHGNWNVKICKTEKSARKWLMREIKKLRLFYPGWNWDRCWMIIPFRRTIRE